MKYVHIYIIIHIFIDTAIHTMRAAPTPHSQLGIFGDQSVDSRPSHSSEHRLGANEIFLLLLGSDKGKRNRWKSWSTRTHGAAQGKKTEKTYRSKCGSRISTLTRSLGENLLELTVKPIAGTTEDVQKHWIFWLSQPTSSMIAGLTFQNRNGALLFLVSTCCHRKPAALEIQSMIVIKNNLRLRNHRFLFQEISSCLVFHLFPLDMHQSTRTKYRILINNSPKFAPPNDPVSLCITCSMCNAMCILKILYLSFWVLCIFEYIYIYIHTYLCKWYMYMYIYIYIYFATTMYMIYVYI